MLEVSRFETPVPGASPTDGVSPLVIRVGRAGESWSVGIPEVGLHTQHGCKSDAMEAACWVGRTFWLSTGRGCMVVLEAEGANRTLAHYHLATNGKERLAS
jgi:hypothetical protein